MDNLLSIAQKLFEQFTKHGISLIKPVSELLEQNGLKIDPTILLFTLISFSIILLIMINKLVFGSNKKRKHKTRGKGLLLWGPCNAGKTSLFYRIRENRFPETLSSMAPNQDTFLFGNKKLNIVDYPGHDRLKVGLDRVLENTGTIIFVLDSSTLKNDIMSVSQSLYDLLTKSILSEANIPVIVACNKQDDPLAVTSEKVKSILEIELERLRGTRSAKPTQVGSHDDEDNADDFVSLGIVGRSFKFDHLDHPIAFVGCSAYSGDIKNLEQTVVELI